VESVRWRIAIFSIVLLVGLSTSGTGPASTLTPCQPRTGTVVDHAVGVACETAAPVVQLVCSTGSRLCRFGTAVSAPLPPGGPLVGKACRAAQGVLAKAGVSVVCPAPGSAVVRPLERAPAVAVLPESRPAHLGCHQH